MVTVMVRHGGLSWALALASFAAALVVLAPPAAVLAAIASAWTRRHGAWGLVGVPVAWAGIDALRSHLALGFPWALPGMTRAAFSDLLPLAPFVGVHGLGAVVLHGSVAVAALLLVVGPRAEAAGRRGQARVAALAVGVVVSAGLVAILLRPPATPSFPTTAVLLRPEEPPGVFEAPLVSGPWGPEHRPGRVRVALVQGAVPQDVVLRADPAADRERARVQLGLTDLALELGARLVVWSESGHPATVGGMPSLSRRLSERLALQAEVAGLPAEAVVGALVAARADGSDRPAPVTNSVLLLDGGGLVGRYDKVHLVPFGEYLPARGLFFWFRRLVRVVGSLEPGRSTAPLPSASARLGAFVCYEAVLPHHVRDLVRSGATVLVNVTNDGWFHGTPAAEQHLRFASMRAAETRRWLVRCANSGISAVFAPDGAEVGRLDEGQRGVLLGTVAPRAETTLHVEMGDRPTWAVALVVGAALTLLPGRKRPRHGAAAEPELPSGT